MADTPEFSTSNGNEEESDVREVHLPCPCGGVTQLDHIPDVGETGTCNQCGRRYRIIMHEDEPSLAWLTVTKPVLVLDLDGTVRYSKSGNGAFINHPDDIAIYPDVEPVLDEFIKQGYMIACASNQGGAAFGHATTEEIHAGVEKTSELLNGKISILQAAYPHPEGTVDSLAYRSLMRKPYYGMLATIENIMHTVGFATDWDNSIVVGDRDEDMKMAVQADVHFEWAWDFFGRAHPIYGQSPRCDYCWAPTEDHNATPGWSDEENAWVHMEGENILLCQDQNWHQRDRSDAPDG